MDGIEMFPEEYAKPLLLSLGLLKSAKIFFPSTTASLLKTYWPLFYFVPILVVHYISMTMSIVKLFTEGLDPFIKADMIPVWLIVTEVAMKNVLFFIKRSEIREVVTHLGSIWRTSGLSRKQMIMKKATLKRLVRTQNFFNGFSFAISCEYLTLPLCETAYRRLILSQDAEMRFPLACVYPFEVSGWYIYLPVYAFQVYCFLPVVQMYLGTQWLLMALASQLTIQFQLLQEDLFRIIPEVRNGRHEIIFDSETSEEGFGIKDFVKRHQDVILLTNKLNASFNNLVFLNMLFVTLIISFFAVAAKASTGADLVNDYVVIVALLMIIFIICYSSELLSTSSTGIAQAAAKTMWYLKDVNHQKNLQFIIMRSQKPCSLTLLGVAPLGLNTFNSVIKTTWSYFSLASQMYERARD